MWEKHKNQIIMGIVGTVLTGVVGFSGKVLMNAHIHTTDANHTKSHQLIEISNKLSRIEITLETNKRTLDQMRYAHLEEKRQSSQLSVSEQSEWSNLTSRLFPGGLPQ